MTVAQAREKFFKKNKNVWANFCYNEKLDKIICFTYDYTDSSTISGPISEQVKNKIVEYSKKSNLEAFNTVLEYFTMNGIDNELLEKISDYYFENSDKTFKNVEEVCDEINKYILSQQKGKNLSNSSLICAYEVLENGDLGDRVFYMDVTYISNKKGQTACKIENTFTDETSRNAGLHTYGIKFLEAVLAKKDVYTLIGESLECDAYQSESTLNQHYKNLGFEVTTDSYGTSYLYKSVDPYSRITLTNEDLQK